MSLNVIATDMKCGHGHMGRTVGTVESTLRQTCLNQRGASRCAMIQEAGMPPLFRFAQCRAGILRDHERRRGACESADICVHVDAM